MAQDRTTPIASRLAGRIRRARGNPRKLSAAWNEWARACLPLNAPPRVNAHPTHAVVDGVTVPSRYLHLAIAASLGTPARSRK